MEKIIIYASFHHKNTEKVARAMAVVLGAEAINFIEAGKEKVLAADLIGFGSGIYAARFYKGLISFIGGLPRVRNKKAFVFSTAGVKQNFLLNRGHRSAKKILEKKGFEIIGEFDCLGHDSYGLLKYIGGINKGRPSEQDLKRAENFAKNLCQSQ